MMLGHEARMETECFGLDVGFDEIEEALGARRHVGQPRRCGTAEQSKSHGKTRVSFGLASAATDASYETHRTCRRKHGTVTLASRDRHWRTADLDIERSLRWHDPGRFNGYVLSQHFAGTPVDPVNLRDALWGCQEKRPHANTEPATSLTYQEPSNIVIDWTGASPVNPSTW